MYQNSDNFALKINEFTKANNSGQVITQPINNFYAIDVKGDGNGIILMFDNETSVEAKITLIGSDDVFCGGDKVIMVPIDGISYIHLEAAPYVQKSGEYKGKILIKGERDNIYFSCIEVL